MAEEGIGERDSTQLVGLKTSGTNDKVDLSGGTLSKDYQAEDGGVLEISSLKDASFHKGFEGPLKNSSTPSNLSEGAGGSSKPSTESSSCQSNIRKFKFVQRLDRKKPGQKEGGETKLKRNKAKHGGSELDEDVSIIEEALNYLGDQVLFEEMDDFKADDDKAKGAGPSFQNYPPLGVAGGKCPMNPVTRENICDTSDCFMVLPALANRSQIDENRLYKVGTSCYLMTGYCPALGMTRSAIEYNRSCSRNQMDTSTVFVIQDEASQVELYSSSDDVRGPQISRSSTREEILSSTPESSRTKHRKPVNVFKKINRWFRN